MPISMLMTLLASLRIPHAVLPHCWPIVSSSDDLQRESSHFDVASTNAFIELCHDTSTLVPTYAGEDRMSIAMAEQLSINQRVSSCVPPDCLCLYRICWEYTIN